MITLHARPKLRLIQGSAGAQSQRARFARLSHVYRELERLREGSRGSWEKSPLGQSQSTSRVAAG